MYNQETAAFDLVFEPIVELATDAGRTYHEIYERWYEEVGDGQGMFGFDRPFECEQRTDEIMLMRLDAGGDTGVDFIEAATLYFLIPRDALVDGDFTRVRTHFGADM
jgi:hypothetical protein